MKNFLFTIIMAIMVLFNSSSSYKTKDFDEIVYEKISMSYKDIVVSMGYNPNEIHLNAMINECIEHEVDTVLVLALVAEESRFIERAFNRNDNGSSDRGYFQLNSDWHNQYIEDTMAHIDYGVKYLKWCLKTENYDVPRALSRYNSGRPNSKLGREYADRVMIKMNYISSLL